MVKVDIRKVVGLNRKRESPSELWASKRQQKDQEGKRFRVIGSSKEKESTK